MLKVLEGAGGYGGDTLCSALYAPRYITRNQMKGLAESRWPTLVEPLQEPEWAPQEIKQAPQGSLGVRSGLLSHGSG